MQSLAYILLAAFGLGFLVFIHELGHYFMARRVGMTVEAFSIGFGKPLFSWERQGVKWQIGWLPFGGYVRIKGMEKKGAIEPYQIPDGFFGRPPRDRIKVALMGPVANIIFAFLAFSFIWMSGGREKSFGEYTRLIGWIDPCSQLFEEGIRPGDEIQTYNGRSFNGFKDLVYAAVTNEKCSEIKGYKIDYASMQKEPFDFNLATYPNPMSQDAGISTIGVLLPASFLIYNQNPDTKEQYYQPGSPMHGSGIQYHDRILWIDGEFIFSLSQLSALINEPKVLLTIQRGEKTFLTRIPRLKISDIKFSAAEKAELDDWQHEAGFKSKIDQLFFIPYNITHEGVVERDVTFFNVESQECRYAESYRSTLALPLQPGDRIVAVGGRGVSSSAELMKLMQKREVRIIVQRFNEIPQISWKEGDAFLLAQVNPSQIAEITSTLGTKDEVTQAGNFVLLKPVEPRTIAEFPLNDSQKSLLEQRETAQKKQIESIQNPKDKAEAIRLFESDQKRLRLGLSPQELKDLPVRYNPSPLTLFSDVFKDTWRTVFALFSGTLNPKWMSGPVGIVQVIHQSWMIGVKEALFWMGLISLNLAILNLLPIPVLDGGHILFAMVESVTKRPIKAKTMEKLIIPFIILLVALFVYLTYHDLVRLFGKFFK